MLYGSLQFLYNERCRTFLSFCHIFIVSPSNASIANYYSKKKNQLEIYKLCWNYITSLYSCTHMGKYHWPLQLWCPRDSGLKREKEFGICVGLMRKCRRLQKRKEWQNFQVLNKYARKPVLSWSKSTWLLWVVWSDKGSVCALVADYLVLSPSRNEVCSWIPRLQLLDHVYSEGGCFSDKERYASLDDLSHEDYFPSEYHVISSLLFLKHPKMC